MGKIDTNNHQDLESLLKHITSKYIQEQFEKPNNTKKENNSSIYLESDTLNMLIVYLLMKMETQNNDKIATNNEIDLFPDALIEELDSIILTNQKGFNEVLSLLKRKLNNE